jgi:hypothetical protein
MKPYLFLALIIAAAGPCVPKPVVPPTPPVATTFNVHIQVGLPSAFARLQTSASNWVTCTMDATGHCYVAVPATLTDSYLEVTLDGYLPYGQHVVVSKDVTLVVQLQQRPPPHIPPPMDAPYNANICGMRDSSGEVMFDGNIPDLSDAKRAEWYTLKQKAGLTDVVLAAKGGYRGHYYDLTRNPARLIELGHEAQSYGFRVTWFLSSGDQGTAVDIDQYFGTLIDALAEFKLNSFWCPGWEVVAGGWTSKDLNHALQVMTYHLPPEAQIWVHLSDTRPTFNSNPVEPTDPWRVWTWGHPDPVNGQLVVEGTCYSDDCKSQCPYGHWDSREVEAWSIQNGYNYEATYGWRVNGLFYQTESGDWLLHPERYPTGYVGHPGYQSRLYEISLRTLIGGRGWRRARVCIFETIAEDYWNGRATEGDAKIIADVLKKMGFTEFGNGQ